MNSWMDIELLDWWAHYDKKPIEELVGVNEATESRNFIGSVLE